MFKIDFSQPTWGPYIAIHIYFIFLILLYWKRYTSINRNRESKSFLGFFVLLFLLFAFDGGDYYNYYNAIKDGYLENLEAVYHHILRIVNNNYILFRLIVWGGALFFFKSAIKRYGLDYQRSLFFLFAVFISIYDYARASLAMGIFFYGLSFLLLPNTRKVISYMFGMSLMILSVFFHNSMIVALAATSILLVPINFFTIFFILALFILLSPYFAGLLQSFVGAELFSEALNDKVSGYSVQEYDNYFSIYEWIRRYIEYGTFFITYLIVASKVYFSNIEFPPYIIAISKITLALLLISIGVLFIPNLTFVLFYRFLFITMIPIVILFCYCEQNGIVSNKTYKFVIILGISYLLLGFAKRVIGGNLV